ncbi:MAG: invasion associated locus B family protein [Gammaproteobacteria bacterium]|nr:invasion associated locus B family protein [Gammaproteobacteria bacterium]
MADAKSLGSFKDWMAHTFSDTDGLVCSMWSQPTKAVGKYKKRGEIFVFVSHRPAEKRTDHVSFELGYESKSGEALRVAIDGKAFKFVTDGTMAWNDTPKENSTLVKLMRKGRKMEVKGISKRGTKTTDTYSLSGFTAAHDAINGACDN